MLSEAELENSSKAHATLVEEYRRLKSDYEEERDARERYKKLARASGTSDKGSPFVVVLIDGDDYVFDNDLVSGGAAGGERAARLLDKVILQSLRARGLEECSVIVRIYANVSGLSRALSRLKLAGPEKRSIAPFVASFNRSNDLFDFVDAGETKEDVASKIRATFRFFESNSQCRQIYFAGCQDKGFINDIATSTTARDRITLVRNGTIEPDFKKLGLRVEDLPNIFRSVPLDPIEPHRIVASSQHPAQAKTSNVDTRVAVPLAPHGGQRNAAPCTFFQKGMCKNGSSCRFSHVKIDGNDAPATQQSWRTSMRASDDSPFATNADSDFMRGNRRTAQQPNAGTSNIGEDFSGLPDVDDIPPGKVPVNSQNQRLDPRLPTCSQDDKRECIERISRHKLCNKYHLNDTCIDSACQYDHRPISEGMRAYLKVIASGQPCTCKSDCRYVDCILGHVCQKTDCSRRGGKAPCKLSTAVHGVDLHFTHYVDGTIKNVLIDVEESPSSHETTGSYSPVLENGDTNGESVAGITKADLARYFNRGNGLPDRTGNGGDSISHLDPDSDDEKAGAGIDASQIPW